MSGAGVDDLHPVDKGADLDVTPPPGSNGLIGSALSLLGAHIWTRALSFITVPYLARTLGPAGFGLWNFAQTLASYATLPDNGVSLVGIREGARTDVGKWSLVLRIQVLRALIAISGATVLVAGSQLLLKEPARGLIQRMSLLVIASALSVEWMLRATRRFTAVSLLQIAQAVLSLTLILAVVRSGDDLLLIPGALATVQLVVSLASLSLLGATIKPSPPSAAADWTRLIREAGRMTLATVAVTIYTSADILMLTVLRPTSEVGAYASAYRVQYFLLGVYGVFVNTLMPVVARLDPMPAGRPLYVVAKYLTSLGLLQTALVSVTAPGIITVLFGSDYALATPTLRLLALQIGVAYVNIIPALFLLTRDPGTYIIGSWIGAGTNVILNLVLIPSWGILGAAVATVAAETNVAAYMLSKANHYVKVPALLRWIKQPFLVGCAVSLLAVFFRLPAITAGLFVLVSTVISLVALRWIKLDELRLLWEIHG